MPQDASHTELFVQQLAEHQNRLHAYIFSLVGDHSRAADVLQETNLILWRKLDEYQSQQPFLPWAFAIARFQVLAHLRDRRRDRVLLDPDLAELISTDVADEAARLDDIQSSLRFCVRTLTDSSRQLVQMRYFESKSIEEVAAAANRSASAVKVALMRARRQLGKCVETKMAEQA